MLCWLAAVGLLIVALAVFTALMIGFSWLMDQVGLDGIVTGFCVVVEVIGLAISLIGIHEVICR